MANSTNDVRPVPGNRPGSAPTGHDRLIRSLLTRGELSIAEQEAIRALPGKIRKLDTYEDIVSKGDRPETIAIIVDGFACRYKILQNGRRPIVWFHVAGDAPDLEGLYLDTMDHSIGTMQETTVLYIPHAEMFDLFGRMPQIQVIFWRWTLADASALREWLTNAGQRDAYGRIAHLLCELITRLQATGLAGGPVCRLPVTELDLAEATGISTVQVNRALKRLRAEGMIKLRAGKLTVLDWGGLKAAGEFDQSYLHLHEQVA
jgi:CRP-like cAMP-binding protein